MKTQYLKIFLLWFLVPQVIGAQSLDLPLEHWGYNFLERLELKGLFQTHDLRVKPLPRKVVAELLIKVEEKLNSKPDLLSRADLGLLDQLRSDLKDELAKSEVIKKPLIDEKHLMRWRQDSSHIYFDAIFQESIASNKGRQFNPSQHISETTLGGAVRGIFGNRLGVYVEVRNAMTRGNVEIEEENFDVSKGSPVVISGPNVFRDRALAYLVWEVPWLRIQAGRDEVEWGPGFHGGLSVSRNMPPTEMIRLSARFRRFKFSSMHAFLRSDLGPKYIAGHRVDLMLTPGLYLGGTETVVYGNRDVEFAYLNPIMPYHVAEHHLGDKDNNMISVDATCTLIPGTKFYGEFFIDDMTSTKSFSKYFGNKFGFLFGGYWIDPLKISNLDVRGEYARIEPFVYTHRDSNNLYTNYDKSIGHWLGPNSDSAFLLFGYQLGRDVRIECFYERIRNGEGEINTQTQPFESDRKQFLSGVVETRQLTGIKLIDQIRRDLFVSIIYTYSDTRNLAHRKNHDSFDHLARFEIFMNY